MTTEQLWGEKSKSLNIFPKETFKLYPSKDHNVLGVSKSEAKLPGTPTKAN